MTGKTSYGSSQVETCMYEHVDDINHPLVLPHALLLAATPAAILREEWNTWPQETSYIGPWSMGRGARLV